MARTCGLFYNIIFMKTINFQLSKILNDLWLLDNIETEWKIQLLPTKNWNKWNKWRLVKNWNWKWNKTIIEWENKRRIIWIISRRN